MSPSGSSKCLHTAPARTARVAGRASLGGRQGGVPWETLLRMLHIVVGIDVEPQVEVWDEDGELVARADLQVAGTNSLHEFDGGHHRDPNQHRDDLRRERRLDAGGYVRRGYTASDVVQR